MTFIHFSGGIFSYDDELLKFFHRFLRQKNMPKKCFQTLINPRLAQRKLKLLSPSLTFCFRRNVLQSFVSPFKPPEKVFLENLILFKR